MYGAVVGMPRDAMSIKCDDLQQLPQAYDV